MSKVQLQGNVSGTGVFTIASPNSNTDRTLTLPDATGTVQVSGNPISGTTGTFSGLIFANGGGVQFPATQVSSANANTLDDYEEGTWTPEFLALSGSVTITYASRYGRYTKIGNLVYADFLLAWSARSGGDGLLGITMPFAPFAGGGAHNGSGVIAYAAGLPVNSLMYGDTGASRSVLIKAGTSNSYFSPGELASGGGQLMGAFTFQTT